jgi:hypothetical protein
VTASSGLRRLASRSAGGAVTIILPRLAAAVIAPSDAGGGRRLGELERYVADRLRERPARVPDGIVHELPIVAGDEPLGAVLLVAGRREPAADAAEFLHLAAVACLTEVAIEEAREEVERNLRGSLLEDLRGRPDLEADEIARRAQRLGCNLTAGVVALCAELTSGRPRHVVATIAG